MVRGWRKHGQGSTDTGVASAHRRQAEVAQTGEHLSTHARMR